MKQDTNIAIIGGGYVGLSTAAAFSNAGYTVYLIEPNKERLNTVKAGKCFFYEEGIEPLIEKAVKEKTLIPTDKYSEAIDKCSIIFSCVGTPDNPDGSSNLSFIFAAANEAAEYLQPGAIYIQKSTVPVGTGKKIESIFTEKKIDVAYVSNPEFLREGTAVEDTLFFDRIVVGGKDSSVLDRVIAIHKVIQEHHKTLLDISGITIPKKNYAGKYIKANLSSAELIKVTANAFLAVKISFANSIAKIADQTDASVIEVMDAVGADPRIGRAFFNAGRGFGGGCFPKDVSGIIFSADEHGVDFGIMKATEAINDSMANYIVEKAQKTIGGYKNKKVAVLGLAFKAGTSDARRSPGAKIANLLSSAGAQVSAYDPKAAEEAKEELNNKVEIVTSAEEAIKNSDAIFVTTEWPEFLELDLNENAKNMSGDTLVDCLNLFDISAVQKAGLQYIGVGRNGV